MRAVAKLRACCTRACVGGGQRQRAIKLIALLARTEIAQIHSTPLCCDEDDTFMMHSGARGCHFARRYPTWHRFACLTGELRAAYSSFEMCIYDLVDARLHSARPRSDFVTKTQQVNHPVTTTSTTAMAATTTASTTPLGLCRRIDCSTHTIYQDRLHFEDFE